MRAGLTAMAWMAIWVALPAGAMPRHPAPPSSVKSPVPAAASSEWKLVFSDDFSGPAGSLPSRERWLFDLGHGYVGGPDRWGTGESENYTDDPANVSLDGQGHLLITPRRDDTGQWTSARIETLRADFTAPPGGLLHMEARIHMPDVTGDAALGIWPAFWALGAPYRITQEWPRMGEIDIMEGINGIDSVHGTLHCGIYIGGPCDEPLGKSAAVTCPGPSCRAAFHTYAFEWDRSIVPAQFRWYVDGHLFHVIGQNELPAETWQDMTDHQGFFILLNVAVGGAFGDTLAGMRTPTDMTEPGHPMTVDYVQVWTREGAAGGAKPPQL